MEVFIPVYLLDLYKFRRKTILARSQTETKMSASHDRLVEQQFGARANAYVTSAVHAAGADLDHIEALLRGKTQARLLDLGAGGGHVSYRAAPHVAEVIACDLSEDMMNAVARTAAARGLGNISVRQGVAEKLPFADGAFDIVASRYSAHHWHDLEAALREIRRVLVPGGSLIMGDGISTGRPLHDTFLQTIEILRDPSHGHNYSIAEWAAALARNGFVLRTVTAYHVALEFTSWVERMRTPAVQVEAIRSLQKSASAELRQFFHLAEDGSWVLPTAVMEAVLA
jgi:ubiquinone/menaquinone biosynthesis C-methylase UbiE